MIIETHTSSDRMERELNKVIKKLKTWRKEIDSHHEEIAVRNFSIGLEVSAFINSFPSREYLGLDLMGRLANAVGLNQTYLSLIARVVSWLYKHKNVRNIRYYMKQNNLANWSQIVDFYFINAHGKTKNKIVLGRRLIGVKASLINLKSALPLGQRPVIDRVVNQIEKIVRPQLN